MMDLIAFMETARTELVRDLWESVQDSLKRLSYLMDVHGFSSSEMEVNRTTLMWPSQLNPVFEKNEMVLIKSLHIKVCRSCIVIQPVNIYVETNETLVLATKLCS